MKKEEFNPQQWEAIQSIEGPILVLAGAGSGKTKVVTSRIVNLIDQGVPPSQILAVTFTNKAAGEMRERVHKLTHQPVLVSTFHSFGSRVLRECIDCIGYSRHFHIYDEEDVEKILKICIAELNIDKIDLKQARSLISHYKNSLVHPEDVNSFDLPRKIADSFPKLYSLYLYHLKTSNALDFDDLLYLPVKIWREHPHILDHYQSIWNFILIDEYQDTNYAQYEIIQLLTQKHKNIFAVGDPDQSIYSWRGADVENILNFEKDFKGAKVIRLEQNYRSTMSILNAANALISYNRSRYEKDLWSDLGEGNKINLFSANDDRTEAAYIASQVESYRDQHISLNNMVVFYRTNAQSRSFEDHLLSLGIPYVIIGGVSFYQRREIKDILAFLKISILPTDYVSFSRTINLPKRGLGDATLEKIRLNANQEGLTLLAYCEAVLKGLPLKTALRLNAQQKEGLTQYLHILHTLHHMRQKESLEQLIKLAIQLSGYLDFLKEDQESFDDRKENLSELIAKAKEWQESTPSPTLEGFLEELTLKSSLDEASGEQEHLNLMTIHNGKGLEFTVTFIAGLEENLFPHINTLDREDAIEEERRLCYVGMTRAKKHLHLSYCSKRALWGNIRFQKPSRFLMEIPKKYLEEVSPYKSSFPPPFEREHPRVMANPYVKKSLPDSNCVFAPGDRIYHQEFGIGQIQEAYQGSLGLTYKVFFDKDQSLKTLAAKFAPLNKI